MPTAPSRLPMPRRSNENQQDAPGKASAKPAGRQSPDPHNFHPSEYMRARRPHLFSDTKLIETAHLDRAVFDHHLGTLTNRKQELAFERFARKLAEKEICPNLVPQTGPTGGGDSKVDTETYPVAEDIAIRWYEGQPEAAQQRRGFAFSTKKTWKPKLKQDVASIAGTQRGYVRVYFITSQYVKDKDRGDTQDALRKEYGFDVQILDRTWILEKIFTNKREQLAIETLELERPLAPNIIRGPQDTRREAELQELDQQINDPARYQGIEYQLVEDCLQTALLARGLERPRIEVDGRFERAQRTAKKYGTTHQHLRIAYARAWTLFWWYEDYSSFTDAYADVEQLAKGSSQAGDLQLLKNLWQLLYAATKRNDIDAATAKLAERAAILREELHRLQQDETRRTTALQARAQELLLDLALVHDRKEERQQVLADFQTVFEQSKGLVDFPTRELIDLVTEIGELFPLDTAFENIFEAVLALAQERDGQATAGRMLLRRGTQLLEQHQPYEAIRTLGRAQQRLALRECRGEFVTALALCARAYEAAGLLWAAHASMLLATSQALQDFWEDGTVTKQAYACLRRLPWLELQLGRIPCLLAWTETAAALQQTIKLDAGREELLRDEWMHLDFALGVLLLKTDFFDLKGITGLATTLERLHLEFSWIALLYALGHEDRLRADKVFPDGETTDNVLAVFTQAVTQAGTDLPPTPEFLDKQKLTLRSSVLGCIVTVELPNQDRSLFLAEGILAALEAFLATSLDAPLLPYNAKLHLKIIPTDFLSTPLEWTTSEEEALIEIRHATADVDARSLYDLLPKLIITITARLAVPADLAHFETLFRDEQAMGRALCITNIGISTGNILGNKAKLRLPDWTDDKGEIFALRRTEPWNAAQTAAPQQTAKAPPIFGTGDPPPELRNVEGLKHSDRKVISLIDIPLWNKAGWNGAGYVEHPDPRTPPLMALLFADKDAGAKIFATWRKELGTKDENGQLRITIVTGIDRDHPAHYRLLIGPTIDWGAQQRGAHFVVVSRINTMKPATPINLDRFLTKYRKDGAYFFAPGYVEPGETVPSFDPELAIISTQLHVRPAWEIAENDPDVIGIQADDNVIIPEGVTDAPVLRTQERIRKRREHAKTQEPAPSRPASPRKVGRNERCPCGSGKKFKKCHGQY